MAPSHSLSGCTTGVQQETRSAGAESSRKINGRRVLAVKPRLAGGARACRRDKVEPQNCFSGRCILLISSCSASMHPQRAHQDSGPLVNKQVHSFSTPQTSEEQPVPVVSISIRQPSKIVDELLVPSFKQLIERREQHRVIQEGPCLVFLFD